MNCRENEGGRLAREGGMEVEREVGREEWR